MVCVDHGYIHHNQGTFFPINQSLPFEIDNKSVFNFVTDVIFDRNQSQPFPLKDGPDK
ncbi:MAG: hypothetical protein RL582_1637 [Bacteroidota bacterium]|jgi:hypothetical protein